MLKLVLAASVSAYLSAPVSAETVKMCKKNAEMNARIAAHRQIGTPLSEVFSEIIEMYPEDQRNLIQTIAMLVYENTPVYETQQEKRKAVDNARDDSFRDCIALMEKLKNP